MRSPKQDRTRPAASFLLHAKDHDDQELSDLIDDDQERAHAVLHGGCIACGDPRGVRCCEFGADVRMRTI